jgi:hypothetical protein
MPMATTCIFQSSEIPVQEALQMRDAARSANQPDPAFECTECGESVKPHADGGHMAAHFEHHERNSQCGLSHPAP